MNLRARDEAGWRRVILKVVRAAMVGRQASERFDPADDDEAFENLLLALYPPDGRDGRRKRAVTDDASNDDF